MLGGHAIDPQALVISDLHRCGYHGLAPVVAAQRLEARGTLLPDSDPIASAAQHLAAAMVEMRRATTEGVPGSSVLYQALLATAGGLARRYPASIAPDINIPAPRRT